MILTDYYRFERITSKAKSRLDCTASTGGYPEFERYAAQQASRETDNRDTIAVGDLIAYLGRVPAQFRISPHRSAGLRFNISGSHATSIFAPDPSLPYGYGDTKGAADALLFVIHGGGLVNGAIRQRAVLEVFVARGQSLNSRPLYELLCDGQLDVEAERLRAAAVPRHAADESREQVGERH